MSAQRVTFLVIGQDDERGRVAGSLGVQVRRRDQYAQQPSPYRKKLVRPANTFVRLHSLQGCIL